MILPYEIWWTHSPEGETVITVKLLVFRGQDVDKGQHFVQDDITGQIFIEIHALFEAPKLGGDLSQGQQSQLGRWRDQDHATCEPSREIIG